MSWDIEQMTFRRRNVAVDRVPFGSRFVIDVDAFPDGPSGSPWGDQCRHLGLPGGPYSITGLSAAQADVIDRECARVLIGALQSGRGPHETAIYRVEPEFFRAITLEGTTYTLDVETTPDAVRIAAMHFLGVVPSAQEAAAGVWTSVEDNWFQSVFENYLRVLVAHRLLLRDGLMLHSAGVILDDAACLFVGASGAGKSTLARKAFAAGFRVLGDDLNAVVEISSETAVAQLPFTGEFRHQALVRDPVPLESLFVLEKGETVACTRLSSGEAAAEVIATAPFVNHGQANLDALLATVANVATRIPVARLTTAVDSSFDEIRRAMRGL
jgi:hypothetical protein